PEWIKHAKDHFVTVSADPRWVSAVEAWLRLERSLGYPEGTDSRLPTQGRPFQVHQWLQAKRKYTSMPTIRRVAEFGAGCQLWWSNLQPEARGRTHDGQPTRPASPLPRESWQVLRRGGPNGLFLVLLALGWW
ncbi:hypothetical protein FKP32DRAFT_1541007, partial [Trametes sanguinea]